ncbi:glycosyltransferase family A protein [Methanolobus sediminis]|uniref:Glycosyltransferase family A protein n=1 Tax=Methanolobus sediminis TaxID=3072978 RepID=A0AA51UKV3_9EURY|nr:glycosyltransferase family A protein [Methanolobus sediminis]WMW25432.1 glycosyltransferase family A protein [Methanolobus sediminis]
MDSNYVLITPIKNEEANIGKLIDSVVSQSLKPILWVIIDDHSTDSSSLFIKKAETQYKWIKSLTPEAKKNNRDLGFHLPKIMQIGFDFAYQFCKSNGTNFEYVGNIDGDIYLDPRYFESMIEEFVQNPKVGVASGYPYIVKDCQFVPATTSDLPSGGVLLLRKDCFDLIGGIPQSYSYDSVINVRARLAGYEVKRFPTAKHFSTRYAQGADGNWKRYVTLGKSHYYIGYAFPLVFLRSIRYSFSKIPLSGMAYFLGYFSSQVNRQEKIPDLEVRNYFRHQKYKEIFSRHLSKKN